MAEGDADPLLLPVALLEVPPALAEDRELPVPLLLLPVPSEAGPPQLRARVIPEPPVAPPPGEGLRAFEYPMESLRVGGEGPAPDPFPDLDVLVAIDTTA